MDKQKNQDSQNNLYSKGTSGGITIPDFKLYYRATVMKTTWNWHKNRQEHQWNQIKVLDINEHTYEHLIIDKEAKIIQQKKESIFNKWCCYNWLSICKKNANRSISNPMHKTQALTDQRPQHKFINTEPHRRESGE